MLPDAHSVVSIVLAMGMGRDIRTYLQHDITILRSQRIFQQLEQRVISPELLEYLLHVLLRGRKIAQDVQGLLLNARIRVREQPASTMRT